MKKYLSFNTFSGAVMTLVLSTLALYLLFGELLRSPNRVYFSGDGDGLQSYYGTLYHVLHDSTYARSSAMNYPYGEMVLFTGNQPVIANAIKFISDHFIDISDYTVGILNILMLFSIVIAALFVYLVFRKLEMPVLLAVLLSVAIPFLSPQIGRLGGHFSLSYAFFIPLMLYLLIRFHDKSAYTLTLITGLLTLLAAFTHFYFLGFFGLLFLFYWVSLIILERERFGKIRFCLPHIFLQIILPILIVRIYGMVNDPVTDRTSFPWGFLHYRAYPESVFLPVGKPYGRFLDSFMTFNHIDWEAWSYTGLVALAGFLAILVQIVRKLARKEYRRILAVTDNRLLDILFWASFAGLIYSFGVPFIFGMEGLLDYLGPVRQMRGIARFSWIFFYLINIVTFYLLWMWLARKKKLWLTGVIIVIAVSFLWYDAWLNSRSMEYFMNNRIPELDDRENRLPENQWVGSITPDSCQAILPIPYFHIGSENLWIQPECDIMKHTFIASLKTGLPTSGVLLSRTSLGQSCRNIELFLEPCRIPEILNDIPSRKPFLLLVARCNDLDTNERRLLSHARYLTETKEFALYSLPVEEIRGLAGAMRDTAFGEMEREAFIPVDGFMVEDSTTFFYHNGYDESAGELSYFGSGCYRGRMREYNTLYWDHPGDTTHGLEFTVSFWLGNARTDLIPRSTIEFARTGPGGEIIAAEYLNLGSIYRLFDGDWALLEHTVRIESPEEKLKVTIWNSHLRKETLVVDELLIRQSGRDVWRRFTSGIAKNNRFYKTE